MTKSLTVKPRRGGDGWTCDVEVGFQSRQTRHTVKVSPSDLARWGRRGEDADEEEVVQDLVRRSFEFLLEREPPSSILARFDLTVIQSYFPEYDDEFTANASSADDGT